MGYVFLAAGGAITWKSKKQTMIALSSTEVEYVALSEAGHKAIWLRNLYRELGFPQECPTPIQGNNKGSVILTYISLKTYCNSPSLGQRTCNKQNS